MQKGSQTPSRRLNSLKAIAFIGASPLDVAWGLPMFQVVGTQRQGMWSGMSICPSLFSWGGSVSTELGWLPASVLMRPHLVRTYLSAKACEHSSDVTTNNELLSSGLELTGLHVSHSGQNTH